MTTIAFVPVVLQSRNGIRGYWRGDNDWAIWRPGLPPFVTTSDPSRLGVLLPDSLKDAFYRAPGAVQDRVVALLARHNP